MKVNKSTLMFLFSTLILSNPAISLASGVPSHSSFIEGDVKLVAHPDRKGAYRYIKSGVNLKNYDRIGIAPIEVFLHENSPYKGIDADDFKVIADSMRQALVDSLEPDYPVVDKAGPKTLSMRIAITGVKLEKKKRSLFGYMPIGAVVTATQDRVAKRSILLDATIEAELIDAQSGERLSVLLDKGLARDLKGDAESWAGMMEILGNYGKRFKAHMDEAHGK